jgi:hypothetical protein
MTIEINRPEIEALIQQRLHSGAFESVEDALFDALEIQSEREVWLQKNKEGIGAKIGADWRSATGVKAFQESKCVQVLMPKRQGGCKPVPRFEVLGAENGSPPGSRGRRR